MPAGTDTAAETGVDTEVAVVGGGPVGTLVARELALLGVDVTVLEKLPEPDGVSKASTLHARTAQTLDRRGLLEAVQPGRYAAARGVRGPVRFHFASIFELDLARVVDEGPVIVGSPQAFAQEVFAADAARLGARVRRDAELVGLDEHDSHVQLRLRSVSGAERTLRARWVVGADGARSAVRRLSGIRFLGDGPTVAALMGEVRLLDPAGAPGGWQRTPRGWTLLWVNPHGASRVCTYDYRGPHQDRHSPVTLDELRGEVERIAGRPVPMDSPDWIARFSDASLQAEQYRRGRILLAGDAAHVHFPAGGQGVNLGLQDAVNLGWKLAAEVRGRAPDGLLDTYHGERQPVAAAVLHNVRAQVALMDPDPRTDALRELFTELMRFDEVNAHLSTMITGAGVVYPVGGRADDPLAGRMLPSLPLKTAEGTTTLAELLHDARPLLLDLSGDSALRAVADPWTDRVRVVVATPAGDAGGAGAGWYAPTATRSGQRSVTTGISAPCAPPSPAGSGRKAGDPVAADLPRAAVGIRAAQTVQDSRAGERRDPRVGQRPEGVGARRLPVGAVPQPAGELHEAGRSRGDHPRVGGGRRHPSGRAQPGGRRLGPVDGREDRAPACLPRLGEGRGGRRRRSVPAVPHHYGGDPGPRHRQQADQRGKFGGSVRDRRAWLPVQVQLGRIDKRRACRHVFLREPHQKDPSSRSIGRCSSRPVPSPVPWPAFHRRYAWGRQTAHGRYPAATAVASSAKNTRSRT